MPERRRAGVENTQQHQTPVTGRCPHGRRGSPSGSPPALTVRLLAALDASGEMLAADIGPEGARLRDAADRARQALGEHRCDELAREGAHVHPLVLVRDTLSQLDGLIELAQATATVAEVSVSERAPGGLSPRE